MLRDEPPDSSEHQLVAPPSSSSLSVSPVIPVLITGGPLIACTPRTFARAKQGVRMLVLRSLELPVDFREVFKGRTGERVEVLDLAHAYSLLDVEEQGNATGVIIINP